LVTEPSVRDGSRERPVHGVTGRVGFLEGVSTSEPVALRGSRDTLDLGLRDETD
jgi:hypothetical protein